MKRPIEVLLVLLRPVFKALNVVESVTCCFRLFQLLITVWEEMSPKFQSTSTLQGLYNMSSSSGIVIQCKQVISKDFLGVGPALVRLETLQKDLLCFFALQEFITPVIPAVYHMAVSLKPETFRVNLCWILSSNRLSFSQCDDHGELQYSRWGLTSVLYNWNNTTRFLYVIVLLLEFQTSGLLRKGLPDHFLLLHHLTCGFPCSTYTAEQIFTLLGR